MGSLRSAAYRAAANSQAHGSRAAGAECRSAQLQDEVPTLCVPTPSVPRKSLIFLTRAVACLLLRLLHRVAGPLPSLCSLMRLATNGTQ